MYSGASRENGETLTSNCLPSGFLNLESFRTDPVNIQQHQKYATNMNSGRFCTLVYWTVVGYYLIYLPGTNVKEPSTDPGASGNGVQLS